MLEWNIKHRDDSNLSHSKLNVDIRSPHSQAYSGMFIPMSQNVQNFYLDEG